MLPQIRKAAVTGIPDSRRGEVPVAIAVLNHGGTLEIDDMIRHCRKHLAGFKASKRLVLADELPRNAFRKNLRRELRDTCIPETAN